MCGSVRVAARAVLQYSIASSGAASRLELVYFLVALSVAWTSARRLHHICAWLRYLLLSLAVCAIPHAAAHRQSLSNRTGTMLLRISRRILPGLRRQIGVRELEWDGQSQE